MPSLQNLKMAIVGLGYVGLPLAIEFGKHFHVTGFDINEARVRELRAGHDHTREVSPEELAMAKHLTVGYFVPIVVRLKFLQGKSNVQ